MSNYKFQQERPKRFCLRCNTDISKDSIFGSSYCFKCHALNREEERKKENALRESYCPFCHMLLAEHKQNEAQLCLYNLRGYVQQKNGVKQ